MTATITELAGSFAFEDQVRSAMLAVVLELAEGVGLASGRCPADGVAVPSLAEVRRAACLPVSTAAAFADLCQVLGIEPPDWIEAALGACVHGPALVLQRAA